MIIPFQLVLSSSGLGLYDVHLFAKAELLSLILPGKLYMPYQILQMQYITEEVINGIHDGSVAAKCLLLYGCFVKGRNIRSM